MPLRTSGSDVVIVSNMIGTCPPMTSISAGALPLYGTCCICVPVAALNISAPRCAPAPAPPDAYEYLFGSAFSNAISSRTLFAGKSGGVTSISGMYPT